MKPSILNNLTYGMYAVGVKDDERPNACIINHVAQISKGQVTRISISINKSNYSSECIKKNGIFTVSVLSQDTPGTVIGALGLVSGRYCDKLKNIRHKVLKEGVPVIKENTCCWMLCEVESTLSAEDQYIFIAKVIAGSDKSVGVPMTYNYFLDVLGGSAPVDSPIYIRPAKENNGKGGDSFVCSVCGYVYDDPDFSFEELPDDWECPVCKVSKKAYVRNLE